MSFKNNYDNSNSFYGYIGKTKKIKHLNSILIKNLNYGLKKSTCHQNISTNNMTEDSTGKKQRR